MSQYPLSWILFLVVWASNINDLIRGEWFFQSIEAVIFWNFMGLLGFILIVLGYKEDIEDANTRKHDG